MRHMAIVVGDLTFALALPLCTCCSFLYMGMLLSAQPSCLSYEMLCYASSDERLDCLATDLTRHVTAKRPAHVLATT